MCRLRRNLLPAVVAAGGGRHRRGSPHRLCVDDPRRGLGLAALALTDLPAQPVVELCDQLVLAPAAEKGVNPAPVGEVRGHRPPRDPARDQIADRVQQLPVTVALRPAAPPLKPGRHRQQRPDGCPLSVRHVRRIPAHPIGMIGRVAVHVREAIARQGGRVEVNGVERVQQRQQGLREPLGMGSHPRATRRPCLHARTAGRSPDQELRSIHTFQDRLRYGFSSRLRCLRLSAAPST